MVSDYIWEIKNVIEIFGRAHIHVCIFLDVPGRYINKT